MQVSMKKTTGAFVALFLFVGPALADGPSCTPTYPRGFQVFNYTMVKTKKHTKVLPVPICTNGDLGDTWRGCTLRYRA